MEKRTIGEKDKDSILLEQYLAEQKPGACLSFLAIEHESGVKMDLLGKGHLLRCLKRMKLEYTPTRGYGITLADPGLVMPILSTRICRIDQAVKRGDRSQKLLQEQFFNSLTADEQKHVLFAGAVFGAIRLAAEQGHQLYKKRGPQSVEAATVRIELPKFE